MLPKKKNSWVLSLQSKTGAEYQHHYFCTCTKEFNIQTTINEPEAPDIVCLICDNDYFKDAVVFEDMQSTKIWKYFEWTTILSENEKYWIAILKYETPIYNDVINEVKLIDKELLRITLRKDGLDSQKISYSSKIVSQYSLFLDEKVQPLKRLLLEEAKESLVDYVITNKSKTIEWIDNNKLKEFSQDNKFKYIIFFLKNHHLKEHKFFSWRMENLHSYTHKYTTELQMLDFIANNRKEKSVKKALYRGYEASLNNTGYCPYSDYIFSRTIDNIDLLVKLYGVYPAVKQHIVTDETFFVADEFIEFLKQHYTEKQVVKLFIEEMQDEENYKEALRDWRDTLRMLQTQSAFQYLDEHFLKVKLTSKKLHDEIVRIFNLVSSELEGKETFDYNEIYLSACNKHEELEFKLPKSVKELSLWAGMLRNCMLGYKRSIHEGRSIIYGVFRAEQLLYAVELNNLSIVQAKAVFNRSVPEDDMTTIRGWNNKLRTIQT